MSISILWPAGVAIKFINRFSRLSGLR